MPEINGVMTDDCSNCAVRTSGICPVHGAREGLAGPFATGCDEAYHYLGESPREFPNAGLHEPAILCGICLRLLRGHRGEALRDREGW